MPDVTAVDMGLFAIFIVVLLGPFLWKRIEQNLEAFLFINGVVAALISGVLVNSGPALNLALVWEAISEPVLKGIVPAVLVAGLVFHFGKERIHNRMMSALGRHDVRWIVFFIVMGLGLVSSIITAIIAALLLVEIVYVLPLDAKRRTEVVIISCFSIGLGAALTPVGEPLSTIVVARLDEGFFYLLLNLGLYIFPGVVVFGAIAALLVQAKRPRALERILLIEPHQPHELKTGAPHKGAGKTKNLDGSGENGLSEEVCDIVHEPLQEVFTRVLKVYLFVMALIFLGGGMSVIIEKYFSQVPPAGLYWANTVSAILDNATLAAAEISPALSLMQIKSALMGLLVAGGMLIPGNIPNIISAQKLKITSRQWARLGVPLGFGTMVAYFVWLYFIPIG